ncbi:MAG: hypothetical protein A2X80_07680 [Geobacteraceae bacterium GWB2_52_12]|nr:MAG: hypothetical protein A2X80_07680 [Geobacteraceae bacterium GWB2_52_12]
MNRKQQDIQLACFSLGDNLFAVDIMRIKEIIQPLKLSSLPVPSRTLEGVINLRGSVIPVMNLRKRFRMPAIADDKPSKFLIVALARRVLALIVDDVLEVITIPAGEIKAPPEVNEPEGLECLLGVCLSGERVFMILDIDSLLDPSELRAAVRQAPQKV